MPGTTQYLPFATGVGANTLSYATYSSMGIVATGHVPGIALAEVVNTTLRQSSVGVAGVAKFVTDNGTANMLDDGSVANFAAGLKSTLDLLYRNGVDSADQLRAVPGYRRLPGGVIIQWGIVAFDDVPGSGGALENDPLYPVLFATPFPNACGVIMLTGLQDGTSGSTDNSWALSVTSYTTGVFSWRIREFNSVVNPGKFMWFAVGW